MIDIPNFAAWNQETLAKYAGEQYTQNVELRGALEQVRLDLKDAMKELRKYQDDWK
tara:strand:- start:3064 stop:3231 length:168 start_codon:yes stop_codon:yes gene_type:complete